VAESRFPSWAEEGGGEIVSVIVIALHGIGDFPAAGVFEVLGGGLDHLLRKGIIA
jgi:hypothetical protein